MVCQSHSLYSLCRVKVRGFPSEGKGFLNTEQPPSPCHPLPPHPNGNTERVGGTWSLEVSSEVWSEISIRGTIRKDKLFCISISRSFSGSWSVAAFGFQTSGSLNQMDSLRRDQSAWCHEMLTYNLGMVSGYTDPAFPKPHRWKVIPTLLYTIFILVSKVA